MFEEFLFRAHLQTFLMKLFTTAGTGKSPEPLEATAALEMGDASPAIEQTARPEIRTSARVWLAILIASILFAAVHPLWMAPLILLLSLGLGYAYERTGNIWVPIFIHALFNLFSTLQFLYLM
jgi:membrane protease YdiL (CAAX protease family)